MCKDNTNKLLKYLTEITTTKSCLNRAVTFLCLNSILQVNTITQTNYELFYLCGT